MELKPIIYVDFDGTIRGSKSGREFFKDVDDICLLPNSEEVLSEYKERGYIILGITNQGGVAFGIKAELEAEEEIKYTASLFKDKYLFDHVAYCPYHPKGKLADYTFDSLCRKPNIGMLVELEIRLLERGIMPDYEHSIFVGDREEDFECATNAGISFMYAKDFFRRE